MVERSRGGGIDSLKALGVYFRQLVLRHKKIADTHQLIRSGAALDAGCQKSLTEVLGHLCGVSGEVAPRVRVPARFGEPFSHACLSAVGIFATAVLMEIVVAKVAKLAAGDLAYDSPALLECLMVDIHRQHGVHGQIRGANLHV